MIEWNWITVREETLADGTIVKYQTTSNGQYNRVSITVTNIQSTGFSVTPIHVVDGTAVTAIDDPAHIIEKTA